MSVPNEVKAHHDQDSDKEPDSTLGNGSSVAEHFNPGNRFQEITRKREELEQKRKVVREWAGKSFYPYVSLLRAKCDLCCCF